MSDTSAEAVTLDAATCLLLDGRFVQEADYRKATARIAELEEERDDYAFKYNEQCNTYSDMHVALGRAQAEVARLRAVLTLYADPTGYTDSNGDQYPPDAELHPGLAARAALQETPHD